MTPNEKIRAVVEAAGECWHEAGEIEGDSITMPMTLHCAKCGELMCMEGSCRNHTQNPSPTDLNELFRLAEKLEYSVRLETTFPDYGEIVYKVSIRKFCKKVWLMYGQFPTPAEALLDALYQAVKEEGR